VTTDAEDVTIGPRDTTIEAHPSTIDG